MNCPSREHLLGYLLGALEPGEQEQVEADLNENPALRVELRRLDECLERMGLADAPQAFDPPPGLAMRTCRAVARRERLGVVPALAPAAPARTESARRFTWFDLAVAAAVLVVAASLFFPALSYSRFQSQIAACQNNLRLLGVALHDYSLLQPDGSFPGPEVEGNRAFAGVYAPTLVSHKLVPHTRVFLCPASQLDRQIGEFRVPTLEELDRASGQVLKTLHRTLGGDYGYSLGYTEGGKLKRPCNSRRSHYALLGDAPSNLQLGRASANHRGRGQNVLYEDGHVRFIIQIPPPEFPDDPYHNREGWIAAGLDPDDAVLGASGDRPIPVTLISE